VLISSTFYEQLLHQYFCAFSRSILALKFFVAKIFAQKAHKMLMKLKHFMSNFLHKSVFQNFSFSVLTVCICIFWHREMDKKQNVVILTIGTMD